ncbi:MAG: NFACT RNA binding domain-containing protein [Candidatus Marinimicrobia bacterium]|nr:NFACT RNA binding domain-containing protein [Candidatus Neomarinimicrobiota bacterium]
MFNSWFHVRLLGQFLRENLVSCAFGKPFTYIKREVNFPVSGCREFSNLHFSIQPPLPHLSVEISSPNPRQRVAVLAEIEGKTVTDVRWHRRDRQMVIEWNRGEGFLLFQLFGINGNAAILDTDFQIVRAFKKAENLQIPGRDEFTSDILPIVNDSSLQRELSDQTNQTINDFFRAGSFPYLSKELIVEICYRCEIRPTDLLINFSERQTIHFLKEILTVLDELTHPKIQVYSEDRPTMAFMDFHSKSGRSVRFFEDLPSGDRFYISEFFRNLLTFQLRQALLQKLNGGLATLQRKLHNQQTDLEKLPTSTLYRLWADAILSNLHRIPPREKSVAIPSMDNPENDLIIPLNPEISPSENAQKYYTKSKNIERSRINLQKSVAETEATIRRITERLEAVEKAQSLDDLRKIEKLLQSELASVEIRRETERQPFHRFAIDGYELLVGKNAHDNDELTFKIARPEDIWFHAQGTTGSHIVLRNPKRAASFPKTILEQCAGLAAVYSKSKHSKLVPVIYTQKKYVWKPRGAEPGAVSVKFEKTLLVAPRLPKPNPATK